MKAFQSEPLDSMLAVGAVGTRSVRLWIRAAPPPGRDGGQRLAVELTPEITRTTAATAPAAAPRPQRAAVTVKTDPEADHTAAFDLPADTPGLAPLEPDQAYRVCVLTEDGAVVGEGRFRTAPESTSGRVAFAVTSCHQPFDDRGGLVPESLHMLEGVERIFDENDVRFALFVGDQIYSDHPPALSLFGKLFAEVAPPGRKDIFECTRDEVRRLYHERHRIFFGVPHMRRILARCPSYPMLDDHEIHDNFGSSPEHSQPRWQVLRDGARDAFFDYQASRVMSRATAARSFHHGFAYGPVAVFVLDLRSERRTDDTHVHVFTDEQLHDLERFLELHADRRVVTVVVTVPLADIATRIAAVVTKLAGEDTDAADRWANPKALASRNRLLRLLRAHSRATPAQRVVLVGGDIHVGSLLRLTWNDGTRPIDQLTSSALSNLQPRPMQWAAEQIPKTLTTIDVGDDLEASISIVPGVDGGGLTGKNPYGGLNLGVIEVDAGEHTRVRYRLYGAPNEDGSPRLVFDSGPVD